MNRPGPRGWQPEAFVDHVREVVGELNRRHDRRLTLRAKLDLPDDWTSADSSVRPRLAWRAPHGQRSEALGVAAQAPLSLLRWQDDTPHPEDLAVLHTWLAAHPVLVDSLLLCGAPLLEDGTVVVPLHLWLPRLWLVADADGSVEAHLVLLGEDDLDAVLEECAVMLAALRPAEPTASSPYATCAPAPQDVAAIADLVTAMQQGAADKVVWSRELALSGSCPRSRVAERMAANRPESWLVDVQWPGDEEALVATPELLVHCQTGAVTTMALAGTGPKELLQSDDRRLHDEHGRVRAFVEDRLTRLGATALTRREDVAQAGPLHHRRTVLTGHRPDSLDALTATLHLHPTPALLGLPRHRALELLADVEAPRGLYGGCVARLACDGSGVGEAVVLLRGVRQAGGQWRARAGAGLVPASQPQDEAAEIANKLAAIVDSLQARTP